MRTTSRGLPGRVSLAAAALAIALLGSSCTGDGKDTPEGETSSSPSEPPPLATTVKVGAIAGKLSSQSAQQYVDQIGAAVDTWIDGAFITGDYPRTTFDNAFPGFSRGAAAQAAKDGALMTNADIGARIDGVTATTRVVKVDLLAVKQHVRGATAHVRLVFTTTGRLQRQVTVTGRLLLTPDKSGEWQVFAYDVSKGAV